MKQTKSIQDGRGRFALVVAMLLLLLMALVWRVLTLQVLNADRGYRFLQHQGDIRAVRTAEIPAYRGIISDRNGEPLAVSTPVVSLWADPGDLVGSTRLEELDAALGLTAGETRGRLAQYAGKQFMYLKRRLIPSRAREILAMDIEGVHGAREYRRFYPAGEVASQLLGFTDVDDRGIAGLELSYDEWLQGEPGTKRYIKDLHGEVVRDIGVVRNARPGRDLSLSIDLRIQYLQHRELQRAMALTGASAGSIVTLDCRTGEVLAMVNQPSFNPNNRGDIQPGATRNRAMTDVFEPGSTMKPLTLVAALESGRYTVDSLIDTSPGYVRVGSKVLPDPKNYGIISLSRVIQKSSQVGITKVALDLGHQPVRKVFSRFGLGQSPGTGFPGENGGYLPGRQRWHPIEEATLAFGYGLTATPLQLARAYSAFAGDGLLPSVTLLAEGRELPPPVRVISAEMARNVRTVLESVTADDGTGTLARIPGYAVAGKTGTVHKVGEEGYIEDEYVALFVGMAPVEDPRIVTVVLIDRPRGEAYGGGSVAAPVFSRVAEGTLRLLGIAPQKETTAGSETAEAQGEGTA